MKAVAALLAVLALVAGGCGGGEDETADRPDAGETTETATGGCASVDAPSPKADGALKAPTVKLDPAKTHTVTFETNCGRFTVELDVKTSPRTTASFYALADSGFFENTTFHRIVPGFVIQGGDPTASGMGGPGYQTVDRPPADAAYTKGVVAMAKTAAEPPGTSGSQFFVVTGADIGLPPEYAILGRVTDGLEVVERIGELGDAAEEPTQPIVIEDASAETS